MCTENNLSEDVQIVVPSLVAYLRLYREKDAVIVRLQTENGKLRKTEAHAKVVSRLLLAFLSDGSYGIFAQPGLVPLTLCSHNLWVRPHNFACKTVCYKIFLDKLYVRIEEYAFDHVNESAIIVESGTHGGGHSALS